MDLVSTVRKEGSRGGRSDFKWSDVQTSQHRENYLGHSLMAPVGRWQMKKDLSWYAKVGEDDDGEDADLTPEERAAKERKEEMARIKQAEKEALNKALGYEINEDPFGNGGPSSGANAVAVAPGKDITGPSVSESDHQRRKEKRRDRSGERRHGRRHHHHSHRHRSRSPSRGNEGDSRRRTHNEKEDRERSSRRERRRSRDKDYDARPSRRDYGERDHDRSSRRGSGRDPKRHEDEAEKGYRNRPRRPTSPNGDDKPDRR